MVNLTGSEKSSFGLYFDIFQLIGNPSTQNFKKGFYELIQSKEDMFRCDLNCLKDFTDGIDRPDLSSKITKYECELQIIMILSQYVDLRDGSLPSPSMASDNQRAVSKYLSELKFSDRLEKALTDQATQGNTSSIRRDVEMYCEEICKGQLSWNVILSILLFTCELAYRRMCLCPGPSKFQRWLSDIDEITIVLGKTIVHWLAQNGGVGKLALFIDKQDPVRAQRIKIINEQFQQMVLIF
ncbi:hypothetical protein AC249_AIPGENE12482 [Exaiptasia diaphana]|nr:hypothetical protein AC249_AIPGENE12482 [Exaiptasia diaphana]